MATFEQQINKLLRKSGTEHTATENELLFEMEKWSEALEEIVEKYVAQEAQGHNGWTFAHSPAPIKVNVLANGTATATGGSQWSGGGRPSFIGDGGAHLRYLFNYGWNAKNPVYGKWHDKWIWTRTEYPGDNFAQAIADEFNAQAPEWIRASVNMSY